MTFSAPRPVVSGKPYPVATVASRMPDCLDDFLGTITLVIDLDGEPYTICGTGVEPGHDRVNVFEKSDQRGRQGRPGSGRSAATTSRRASWSNTA